MENFFLLNVDVLSPRQKETFMLYFQDELSYQEISEKLSISLPNVRKRISQARAILRIQFNEYLGKED
jgi:RNA polymerase sigma-70 factor (ECF subfamily)